MAANETGTPPMEKDTNLVVLETPQKTGFEDQGFTANMPADTIWTIVGCIYIPMLLTVLQFSDMPNQALANLSDGFQQNPISKYHSYTSHLSQIAQASSTNVVFNHLLGTKVYTSIIQTRISNALLIGSVI